MAMTADEMIEFYQDEVEDCLEVCRQSEDGHILATNFACAFEYQLLIAMLMCRKRADGWRPAMSRANEIGLEARLKLFPKYRKLYLSDCLVVESAYVECAMSLAVSHESTAFVVEIVEAGRSVDREVQGRFLLYLLGEGSSEDLSSAIDRSAGECSKHFADTYRTYLRLVDAARSSSSSEVVSAYRHAVELYSQRSMDSYYSGGREIEGGLEPNDIVDFRLLAIQEFLRIEGVDQRSG